MHIYMCIRQYYHNLRTEEPKTNHRRSEAKGEVDQDIPKIIHMAQANLTSPPTLRSPI